jgi:hypothetical protein
MTFPAFLERRYGKGSTRGGGDRSPVGGDGPRFFDVPPIPAQGPRDGRPQFVSARRGGEKKWDIIYLDAFNSFSIPYHLTTKEFTEGVASLLADAGIVLANTIDIVKFGGVFLKRVPSHPKAVFPHVAVYGNPPFPEPAFHLRHCGKYETSGRGGPFRRGGREIARKIGRRSWRTWRRGTGPPR